MNKLLGLYLLLFNLFYSCNYDNEKQDIINKVQLIKPGFTSIQVLETMGKLPDTFYVSTIDSGVVWDYGTPSFGSSSQISVVLSKDSIVQWVTWGR